MKITPREKASFLKDIPEGISPDEVEYALSALGNALSVINPFDPPEVKASDIGDVVFGESVTELDAEGNAHTYVSRTPINEYLAKKISGLTGKIKDLFGSKTYEITADKPPAKVKGVATVVEAKEPEPEPEELMVESGGQGQPIKQVKVPSDISRTIKEVFGDKAQEAARVLHHPYGEQVLGSGQGENAGFKVSDIDVPNYVGNDPKKGIKQIYNPFTDSKEDSIDRGLFRINNATFYTYLNGVEERKLLKKAGIIDTTDLGKIDWKNAWDKMNELEYNVKMAKIINDKQGWGAWFAAPIDLK